MSPRRAPFAIVWTALLLGWYFTDLNLGPDSPLKIDRGLNALWSKGGLQYAPPIR